VSALVEAAADYECKLLVFPEYFSIQLLLLGNVRRPVREQVRDLASQAPRVVELFSGLAARHKLSILGGTIPVQGEPDAPVHNEAFFFNPQGRHATQGKLHMTRFETEDWRVTAR
jgi:predicted amidohydrolase